jgi:hypothetical protein
MSSNRFFFNLQPKPSPRDARTAAVQLVKLAEGRGFPVVTTRGVRVWDLRSRDSRH